MRYGIYDGTKVIASFVVPTTLRSNQPVFVSDTLSLKRAVQRRSAQRWEIESRLSPLNSTANDLMVSFITKGFDQIHDIITPQNYAASNSRTANGSMISGTHMAAGTTIVTIAAMPENSGTVIPKGTFIGFGTSDHTKVYMTTTDCVVSSNNVSSFSVFPQLRKEVAIGTLMYYRDDVIMKVRYDTDVVRGMVYENGILMDNGVVKLVEAV